MKHFSLLLFLLFPLLNWAQTTQYPLWEELAIPIDTTAAGYDWSALGAAIGDKELVFLGEFTHGAKELFAVRNDLIAYLNREKGFQVVLFEAGFGEMATIYSQRDSLSPAAMTQGFFGVWRTPEFVELMDYISQNWMEFAGFDIQRSGRNFEALLQPYLEEKGQTHFLDIEQRFEAMERALKKKSTPIDSVAHASQVLMADYDALNRELGFPRDRLEAAIFKTLENRKEYIRYQSEFLQDQDWSKRWAARDLAMAQNLRWLVENIYPGLKIIVVGHNFHLARYNEREEVMGEFLDQYYSDKTYILGNFAASGSYADNYGREKTMEPVSPDGDDIKQYIEALQGPLNFVPIPEEKSNPSSSFWNSLIVNDTFIDLYGGNRMVLGKHFDGLLLFKKVTSSAPQGH